MNNSQEQKLYPGVRLFDLEKASVYMGISYETMKNWVLYHKIKTVKLPSSQNDEQDLRAIRIDRYDLDALIEQRKEL